MKNKEGRPMLYVSLFQVSRKMHALRLASLAALLALATAALIGLQPDPALSQTQSDRPNPPTNVTVSDIGDTHANISWTAGGNLDCPDTEYFARIYDVNDDYSVKSLTTDIEDTNWHTHGLDYSTTYDVEVQSYGLSCKEWSDENESLPWTRFTTTADDDVAHTNPDGNERKNPVAVIFDDAVTKNTTTSATLTWSAGTGATGHCPQSDPKSYGYHLDDVTDPQNPSAVSGEADGRTGSTASKTFTGLTVGKTYLMTVLSYSSECGNCSPSRTKKWTQ